MDTKPDETGMMVPDGFSAADRVVGVGIDIVSTARVARILKKHGQRFLSRCFCPCEVEYCLSKRDPVPHLAARLAAKEAAFKALGGTKGMGIGFRDFEVTVGENGAPGLVLHDTAAELADSVGVGKIWVSLTHEKDWSAAVVVVTAPSS